MKKSIFFLIILFSLNVFAQGTNKSAAFSKFHFGLYGGPNFTFPLQTGYLLQLEAGTNISSRINIKASIGFSSLFENKDNNITTYHCFILNQTEYYRSEFYKIDKYEYAILPLSLGLEYSLTEGEYSPYLICEGGYNIYSVEVRKSGQISGAAGTFGSLNQLPAQYRNEPPRVPDDTSFRIGFGLGTRISIAKGINLELKYLYNINTSLINCHQLLAGISI
jgi:hypothetical protein